MRVLRGHQNQQMVENVGAFGDEMILVVPERGDDRLNRFLAQLFCDLGRAALDQLGGIGLAWVGGLSGFDFGEERIERVGGRGQGSRSPGCEPG